MQQQYFVCFFICAKFHFSSLGEHRDGAVE